MFYKEDPVRERMNRLYTNDKKNKLSEEFMSSQALEDLEVAAQSHPLYDDMKEGDEITVVMNEHVDYNGKEYPIASLPENLMSIIQAGGLVKAMRKLNGLD